MLFLGLIHSLSDTSFWKRAFFGGELFASGTTDTSMDFSGQALFNDTNNDTLYSTSYETSVKSSIWQYGLDLRPGFLLMPLTLIYGRVGVSAAEIKAHSNASVSANNGAGITWALADANSKSNWKATFRLGLGIEQLLTSKLHLRGDYIFTNYGVVSFTDTVTGQDSEGDSTRLYSRLSSHVQNNAIFLGLSYYFH